MVAWDMKRALASYSVALLALFACSPTTRLVPMGAHPVHVQEFIAVPYPPPPAEVEELTYRNVRDECAWVDGYYGWQGHWVWHHGGWVVPQLGCYYAPAVVAWSKAGEPRLYFTPPRWYRDEAATLSENEAVCPAPQACR